MHCRFVVGLSTLVALAGCAQQSVKPTPAPAQTTTPPPVIAKQDPILQAHRLIAQHNTWEARQLLLQFVATMPADWKPIRTGPQGDATIAYWNVAEFAECSGKDAMLLKAKTVSWVNPSYSQAWYLLGFMEVEGKDFVEANKDIDHGLALEPDHPTLLNEKATDLQKPGTWEQALAYSRQVVTLNRCVTKQAMSRAWRAQGVSLTELGRLDEAENALKESLKVDPGNANTLRELDYVRQMRTKQEKKPVGIFRTN